MLFSSIYGYKKIKKRFIVTIKKNKIFNSQIFYGKKGSPNLKLVMAITSYINCEKKKKKDSCGNCNSCLKIKKFIYLNTKFFFPINKKNKNIFFKK